MLITSMPHGMDPQGQKSRYRDRAGPIYIYIYVCMYTCVCVRVFVCVCVRVYPHILHKYIHTHTYIHTYICMYVYMYIGPGARAWTGAARVTSAATWPARAPAPRGAGKQRRRAHSSTLPTPGPRQVCVAPGTAGARRCGGRGMRGKGTPVGSVVRW